MTIRLTAPLRREVDIDGEPFTVVVSPEGVRLTRKRFRDGVALSWCAIRAMGELERMELDRSQ